MIDISAGGGNGSSLTPGQYTDTGADVPSVSSKSGVKDSAYWNSHYGEGYVNSVTSSINQAIEEYDVETDIANEAIEVASSFYAENGVVYKVVTNEDGTTEKVPLGNIYDLNGLEIDTSQINWDSISTTANGALNGNFLDPNNINKEYWGDNGQLTIQVNENGAVLILENGVPMGWTSIQSLATSLYANREENGILKPSELTDGGCRFNLDGSIDYMVNGKIIHVEEGDIFTDKNGGKFIINTNDSGDVCGIITFDENGNATGFPKSDVKNFLNKLDSGEYFQANDGTLIYNSGQDFHIVDGGSIYESNGQTFFVSNTKSDGEPSGIMIIEDGKLSPVYGSGINSFLNDLNLSGTNVVVSTNGDVIYRDASGNIKTLDGGDSYLIGDQRYFVTKSSENGKITAMWTVDENGILSGLSGANESELNNALGQLEQSKYVVNENGSIIYGGYVVDSSQLTKDENGNMTFKAERNRVITFNEDGTFSIDRVVSSEQDVPIFQDSDSPVIEETTAQGDSADLEDIPQILPGSSIPDSNDTFNGPFAQPTAKDMEIINVNGAIYTKKYIDNNTVATYGPDGELKGVNINGIDYNSNNIPANFDLSNVPTSIEVYDPTKNPDNFEPVFPKADLDVITQMEQETGIGPGTPLM